MGLGRLRDNSASGVPSITHLSTLHTQSLLGPGCHLSCLLILVGVGVGVPLWAAGICSVRLSAQHLPFQNSCLKSSSANPCLYLRAGAGSAGTRWRLGSTAAPPLQGASYTWSLDETVEQAGWCLVRAEPVLCWGVTEGL